MLKSWWYIQLLPSFRKVNQPHNKPTYPLHEVELSRETGSYPAGKESLHFHHQAGKHTAHIHTMFL
jgi:hypothetical protein